jgi:hypothetical protein
VKDGDAIAAEGESLLHDMIKLICPERVGVGAWLRAE